MQKVMTAPVKKEKLRDSSFIRRTKKPTRWLVKSVPSLNGPSPNGDQPHVNADSQVDSHVDNQYDPYPYGWRYIQNTTEDGQVESERVALTLYDLLHPQLGDVVMHKPPHEDNYAHLKTALTTQFRNHSGAFVSSDLRIDLNLPGVEPLVPDISVIFNVDEEQAWGTFDIKKEGTLPSVAFEITSPSTRDHDFGKKREYYAQAGIPFYVIVDIEYEDEKNRDSKVSGYELYAHKLIDDKYVAIQPDEQGRCWLPPLEISVAVSDEGVLCYNAQGELLMSHEQLTQALADTEQRVNEESERAAKQERIAQEESERAAEQERRANEESARAAQAEAENARLRALLAQLGSDA